MFRASRLAFAGGKIKVFGVLGGSQADTQGVLTGDTIVAVGSTAISADMTHDHVMELIVAARSVSAAGLVTS